DRRLAGMARPSGRRPSRQRLQAHAGAGLDRRAGRGRRQPHQAGRRRLGTGHSRRPTWADLRSVPPGHRAAWWCPDRAGYRRRRGPGYQRPLGGWRLRCRRGQHGGDVAAAPRPRVSHAHRIFGDTAASAARRLAPTHSGRVTVLQGVPGHHVLMNALTPTQRDRGLERLRRLTFGATAGALVAVVGVSYVAAASYAGTSSANASATAADTTTSTTTTTDSSSSSTSSSNSLQQAQQAP